VTGFSAGAWYMARRGSNRRPRFHRFESPEPRHCPPCRVVQRGQPTDGRLVRMRIVPRCCKSRRPPRRNAGRPSTRRYGRLSEQQHPRRPRESQVLSDAPGEDRAVFTVFRVFLGDEAEFALHGNVGMVRRDLLDLTAAHKIDARITDVPTVTWSLRRIATARVVAMREEPWSSIPLS